jgi:hypothetical protein
MSHSIVIVIPYFGPWPEWMNFWVETCRANRTIDWILFGDAEPPENKGPNVRFVRTTFEEYRALLSDRLGTPVGADTPYKLCDIRPALGVVHADLVKAYDFIGFGDLDVFYGDIRATYDDDTLRNYDLLSSHPHRVSGHFCLMRNREDVITAFRRAPGWKAAVSRADYLNFDERALHTLLTGKRLFGSRDAKSIRGLFREAYSTPGATEEMRWYWQDGVLTNEFYPRHPFMYLHVMSWHNNRWFSSQPHVQPGSAAPWMLLPQVVQMNWREARKSGFMISPKGIQPIERRAYPSNRSEA